MGQEVSQSSFTQGDFDRFYVRLEQETRYLTQLFRNDAFSSTQLKAGLEIEAWLVNDAMRPSAINEHYLATVNEPLASAELAKFNIELNTYPLTLSGDMFSQLHQQITTTWHNAAQHAESLDSHLLMTGILPTLLPSDLTIKNMSNLNRYRALNEQILATKNQDIHLNITGDDHLDYYHRDIMLESATTSLQIHTKVPLDIAHHYYNASIMASAAVVAVSANAPYLFRKSLWHESRIPLFEQAVDIGGYDGAAHGPFKRVSFGTDYAKESLLECFEENLQHFPILLPEKLGDAFEQMPHLKLHNGTIWRWNRPLIGEDEDGTPHLRIEHRTPAAGPTLIDTVANAAFYFGLAYYLCNQLQQSNKPLPFYQARDNFYHAARYGLDSHVIWFNEQRHRLQHLLLEELLPSAESGLKALNIAQSDIDDYLGIIRHRVETKQTGSEWQRQFIHTHPGDFEALTRYYFNLQQQNKPVSEWPLS